MLKINLGDCRICVSGSFFALLTFVLLIADREIAMISLFSSFIHEAGHIAAIYACGEKISFISFTATGIHLEKTRCRQLSCNKEILISLGGVGVNLTVSAVFLLLFSFLGESRLRDISLVNLIVGCFNILPVGILDGARAMYFFILKGRYADAAESIMLCVSCVTVIFLLIFVIYVALRAKTNFSLIIVTVYLIFLLINHLIQLKK